MLLSWLCSYTKSFVSDGEKEWGRVKNLKAKIITYIFGCFYLGLYPGLVDDFFIPKNRQHKLFGKIKINIDLISSRKILLGKDAEPPWKLIKSNL